MRWNGDGPRWGGFLDQIDSFDPQFFSISPREAEQIDPQQRLLLEVCYEALENAGRTPERLAGTRSGVFVGISSNEYSRIAHAESIDPYSTTGNAASIAANRISTNSICPRTKLGCGHRLLLITRRRASGRAEPP